MVRTNKKEQYALKAILELARNVGQSPIKSSTIASAQQIPRRYLEVILSQLKNSGFVESKRGYAGGYYLVRRPDEITVGDVMRFMYREEDPAHKISCQSKKRCPFGCDCAFVPLWKKVNAAIYRIYDETTLQNLLDGMN